MTGADIPLQRVVGRLADASAGAVGHRPTRWFSYETRRQLSHARELVMAAYSVRGSQETRLLGRGQVSVDAHQLRLVVF